MQKLLSLLVFVSLLSFPLMAQDYPKVEVFGGYQFTRLGGDADLNLNGWNASFTGNFNKHFGVAADFSGAYKTETFPGTVDDTPLKDNVSTHIYSYAFGPVVSMDSGGKVNPFAHALFGGFHSSQSESSSPALPELTSSTSQNGFIMMLGGGVDAKVNKALAVRLVQADWVFFRASGDNSTKNVRISTGLVLRF